MCVWHCFRSTKWCHTHTEHRWKRWRQIHSWEEMQTEGEKMEGWEREKIAKKQTEETEWIWGRWLNRKRLFPFICPTFIQLVDGLDLNYWAVELFNRHSFSSAMPFFLTTHFSGDLVVWKMYHRIESLRLPIIEKKNTHSNQVVWMPNKTFIPILFSKWDSVDFSLGLAGPALKL